MFSNVYLNACNESRFGFEFRHSNWTTTHQNYNRQFVLNHGSVIRAQEVRKDHRNEILHHLEQWCPAKFSTSPNLWRQCGNKAFAVATLDVN